MDLLLTIIQKCVCMGWMMFIFLSHKSKWRLIACGVFFYLLLIRNGFYCDGRWWFDDNNQKYEMQTLILSDRLCLAFCWLMSSCLAAESAKVNKNSHTHAVRTHAIHILWKFRKIHKGRSCILSWPDFQIHAN